MKSIIYTLVAIILFGMVATGLTRKPANHHKIIIQSTESQISTSSLTKSVDIISARLKSFGVEKFEVTVIAKNQIQVILTNDTEMKLVQKLITQKGVLEFYETWNYLQLKQLLKDDTQLLSLMHSKPPRDSSAEIGCTTPSQVNLVNDYLNAAQLGQRYKFVWSDLFEKTEVCLYALKPDERNGALLNGSAIERMTAKTDSKSKKDYIDINFKKSAISLWSDATKRNINKSIALLLDEKVLMAPSIRSEINGGNCEITGSFTQRELRFIAAIGNNGELPVGFVLLR